jgi:flavin reductase (DIM6/NTAB) family NADH-FMN oxidoreductase RutF
MERGDPAMLANRGSSRVPVRMKATPFERLMAAFDPPLVVVTAASRRSVAGCLVEFSTQCSVEPPRYCVYVAKAGPDYDVLRRAGHLMVHFLDRRQTDIAAAVEEASLSAVRWRTGPDGRTPQLTAVDAWLFGRVVGRHDAGDHVAIVVDPLRERVPRRLRPLGSQQARGGKQVRSG